jgi:lipopolysaccharide transport system permease protein
VFFSQVQENVNWLYDTGAPFLLAEVEVDEAGASLRRAAVTSMARFRRRVLLRSFGRAWVYPFRSIWKNRNLIRTMVRRDILGRYRGSFGGVFWALLNPLLLMLTYFFVFGVVLEARFPQDPSRSGFALYFLAGMLPWMAFSEAVGRAPTLLLEHRIFIKKLIFPIETLPVNLVVAGLVSEFFAFLMFLVFLFVSRGSVPASIAWLPVVLIPQILFTAGITWFLAALGVFARDLGQISGFLLTLWFFLTPICYPEASLPPEAAQILSKNPMYVLVRAYRTILEGHAPSASGLWKLTALSLFLFIAGHAWFYKLKKSFADVI